MAANFDTHVTSSSNAGSGPAYGETSAALSEYAAAGHPGHVNICIYCYGFSLVYLPAESPPTAKDESFVKLRETFVVQGKIGAGTFSKVYLAYIRGDVQKKRYAVKHIKQTTHPEKLRREVFCLLKIG